MFVGTKIRLRAMEKSDLTKAMDWVNDQSITQFLPHLQLPTSRQSEFDFLTHAVEGHHPRDRYYAVETLQGEYLGAAGLHSIDWVNRRAELGIIIGRPDLLGQGYGSDAVRTLLQVAFAGLNLEKVYLRTTGSNLRAQAAYRKCGFVEVGRLQRHLFLQGLWHDEVYMEIFRDVWTRVGRA